MLLSALPLIGVTRTQRSACEGATGNDAWRHRRIYCVALFDVVRLVFLNDAVVCRQSRVGSPAVLSKEGHWICIRVISGI